jgi:HME family heavy-metal exporter
MVTIALVAVAMFGLFRLDRDFLPPFNEGAVQINVLLPPGTSLARSTEVAKQVDERLQKLDDITAFVTRTGRAEQDEHVMQVNVTEIIATIDPETPRSREEVIDEISEALADIPGIVTAVEQPLAHLISHMLSGVKAQVAIKLYGDDLDVLRREADKMKAAIETVPGIRDLQVEQQVNIPQLRIEIDGHKLEQYGLRRLDVNEFIETAMQGDVVSEVLDGQRTFDLLVRLDEDYREDLDALQRLVIELPSGGTVKLEDVASIYRASGPNTINREQVRRRITIQCNVSGRGLVDVVNEIRTRLAPIEAKLPTGYFVEYGGQFQSQQSASQTIAVLFVAALAGIFLVLFKMFRSVNLALQVMAALPMAFIGAVAALVLTGQTLTVAAMVGFIALVGVASRNGILLLNHYLHLVKYEGEGWTKEMILRGGLERLAPVLMTALTAGIALVPLTLSAGEPGKEILYPVATVIVGGLISSTLLDFFVHPALFWTFGRGSARRVVESKELRIPLVDESEEQ